MWKRNIAAIVLAALVVGVGAYAWAEGAPPDPTTSTTAPAASGRPAAKPHRPGRAARLALLQRSVHGDVIVKGKDGKFVTVTFDKGKVTNHSDTSITLERPDGQSVTLALDSATKYRGITSAGELQDGKGALVLSKGGTATVVAQRPASAGNTAGPTGVEPSGEQVPAA